MEVLIALFVRDGFIRPYVGDVLVVMFIFFAIRSIWPVDTMPLAIGVLCFAVAVEATQALGLIRLLGWSDNTLAMVVLGNTFQWGDLFCYLIGCIVSLCIVRILPRGRHPC